MQRIGILGGTFDPPHIGHLILAQYTMESLNLDHVLFVPVGNHPHKEITRTSADQRLEMLRLAIGDNSAFSISEVDLRRPGPHYSADTVQIIQEEHPDAALHFVMGGDNLKALPTWTRAQDLYACCRLAVMKRSDEKIYPHMHDDVLPGLAEKVDIVDAPMLGIWLSSTHVIERLRDGLSVRYLVPDAVRAYIQDTRAYQKIVGVSHDGQTPNHE